MTKQKTLLSMITVAVVLLEQSRDEGPQADKQKLYNELEELRRRLTASAIHTGPGRPRICECGTCKVCVNRERIIRYRQKKVQAVA